MKNGLFKVVCVTSVLAMLVAFGSPQLGKRKGTSGGGGGGSSSTGGGGGGGNSGGGGGGGQRREEPPPRRSTGGGGGEQRSTTGGGGGGGNTGGGGGWTSGGGGGDQGGRRGGSGGDQGGGQSIPGGRVIISGDRGQGGGGRFGDDFGRRRAGNSRSGDVRYGTENNGAGRIQINGLRIERPPSYIGGRMERRVLDQERVSLVRDGWRVGYYHYNRRWNDDWFCYPYYVFNPWQPTQYVCSPWYYYPSCPPYLNSTRIVVINSGWPSYGWTGDAYRWNRRDDRYDRRYDERDRNEIDYAIDDIVDAWERYDTRAINRLVPRGGNINMYFDGHYNYSVPSDDFYDIFADGIDNVDTRRYDIEDVRYRGNGVRIVAKHEYTDPWNRRNFAYHMYFLERDGRGYVIREFGTSSFRAAW